MESLNQLYAAALSAFVNRLKPDKNILAVVLSGSMAYRQLWEKSDIDLWVITKKSIGIKQTFDYIIENGIKIGAHFHVKANWIEDFTKANIFGLKRTDLQLCYCSDSTIKQVFTDYIQERNDRIKYIEIYNLHSIINCYILEIEKMISKKCEFIDAYFVFVENIPQCLNALLLILHDKSVSHFYKAINEARELEPELMSKVMKVSFASKMADLQLALAAITDFMDLNLPPYYQVVLNYFKKRSPELTVTEAFSEYLSGYNRTALDYDWLCKRGLLTAGIKTVDFALNGKITVEQPEYSLKEISEKHILTKPPAKGKKLLKKSLEFSAVDQDVTETAGDSLQENCYAKNLLGVRGARVHNLKNINVDIPINQLTVITGVSGSGKSSLAFEVIFGEGHRRFLEAVSYNSGVSSQKEDKAVVEEVINISPAVAISQKQGTFNSVSTLGTLTGLNHKLTRLFLTAGQAVCPYCNQSVAISNVVQLAAQIKQLPPNSRVEVFIPVFKSSIETAAEFITELKKRGYFELKSGGQIINLHSEDNPRIDFTESLMAKIDILSDLQNETGVKEQLLRAFNKGNSLISLEITGAANILGLTTCQHNLFIQPLNIGHFSVLSKGACSTCAGIGYNWEPEPESIIKNPAKSLKDKALDYFSPDVIERYLKNLGLGKEFLSVPFKEISPEIQRAFLYGLKDSDGKQVLIGAYTSLKRIYQSFKNNPSNMWIDHYRKFYKHLPCTDCECSGLSRYTRMMQLNGKAFNQLERLEIRSLLDFLQELEQNRLSRTMQNYLNDLIMHLQYLSEIGLYYLSLKRKSKSLSGGELQRARIVNHMMSDLTGLVYVLDEPSIGLHPADTQKVINALYKLRDLGNTVIVVEHDLDTMRAADYIVELGPAAGVNGGAITASGTLADLLHQAQFLTGHYLTGCLKVSSLPSRQFCSEKQLVIQGARANNLKNVTATIPLGGLIVVTGVSGSGKSTLIHEILYKKLDQHFNDRSVKPGFHDSITGIEYLKGVRLIDQLPVGRSSRSNPATYLGIYDKIRKLLTCEPAAKALGLKADAFSFNVKGGRCEECQGEGVISSDSAYLADYSAVCPSCEGKRFKKEVLLVRYREKNIDDILNLTVAEAEEFFKTDKLICRKLAVMNQLGLEYLTLGQPVSTLSGGECQRLKLTDELANEEKNGNLLYILDEPTTGLHLHDIKKLLDCLNLLVAAGNTVLVIEHQPELIKCADYVIDLGPQGGKDGGELLYQGSVAGLKACQESLTGRYL